MLPRILLELHKNPRARKTVGRPERRYFHHATIDEYNEAIENFEKQITGLRETERKLEIKRETAEARRRLRKARKKRAKKEKSSS